MLLSPDGKSMKSPENARGPAGNPLSRASRPACQKVSSEIPSFSSQKSMVYYPQKRSLSQNLSSASMLSGPIRGGVEEAGIARERLKQNQMQSRRPSCEVVEEAGFAIERLKQSSLASSLARPTAVEEAGFAIERLKHVNVGRTAAKLLFS